GSARDPPRPPDARRAGRTGLARDRSPIQGGRRVSPGDGGSVRSRRLRRHLRRATPARSGHRGSGRALAARRGPRGCGSPVNGLPRSENTLEEALLAARRRGDVEPLLPVLADADVFLPTPEGVGDDAREVPLALVRAGGDAFVPVFSSLDALARYRPERGGFLQLSGRALAAAVRGGHLVIVDPGSELAVPLRPDDLARLRDVPPREGDADLLIGEPREKPREAIEAIRRFAAGRPEVRAAYRALLVLRPGTEAE